MVEYTQRWRVPERGQRGALNMQILICPYCLAWSVRSTVPAAAYDMLREHWNAKHQGAEFPSLSEADEITWARLCKDDRFSHELRPL